MGTDFPTRRAPTRRSLLRQAMSMAALAPWLGLAPAVLAQAFPSKPLKIVVPFAAGGPTDAIARVVAERMAADLGQAVVIENKPGASTMLGAEAVARAPKDGHTLLLGTTSTFSTNPHLYKAITYTLADFAPIGVVAKTDWVIAVNNDLPIRNLREFVDYGRANPGRLNYGMMGVGSSSHFVGKMIEGATTVRMVDVPYKGSGPALADLMGGQVQVYVDAINSSLPLARAGKIRIIGMMGEKRAPIAPEIPTFAESGFPDVVAQSWYGLFAPSGTPRAVVDRLNAAVQFAMRSPEVARRYATDGTLAETSTPEGFQAMIRADAEKWGRLIQPLGIKLD